MSVISSAPDSAAVVAIRPSRRTSRRAAAPGHGAVLAADAADPLAGASGPSFSSGRERPLPRAWYTPHTPMMRLTNFAGTPVPPQMPDGRLLELVTYG